MSSNYYKVFFTINFFYQIDEKKKVSKSFKSDLDINDTLLKSSLTDQTVHKKWTEYVLKASVNDLNPPIKFNNSLVSEKKLITHRIVNLMYLTEIHKSHKA